jgi:hypothetical protein
MGSGFITKTEAAALMGCSPKSIYRYVSKGLIRHHYDGRYLMVCEEDVLGMRLGRREMLNSPYTRDIIDKMVLDIQQLKTQMETVLRMLNINYSALNFTDPEYRNFYLVACQLANEGWSPHVEDQWADYFVRLKIEDLESLERITQDPHPWRPLLKLAATMHLRPWNTKLRDMFGAGRSNVHQVSGMWSVMKEKSPKEFHMLVNRDSSPERKLVRRLDKEQKLTR